MIDLMLKNAGKPPLGTYTNVFAIDILSFDHNILSTTNIVAKIAGNAQTTFSPQNLALFFNNLRIDQGNPAIFILSYENANRKVDLRSGQTGPIGGMHRFKHIID